MSRTEPDDPSTILIYDGECKFCHASVDLIFNYEKEEHIRFLWSQSDLAQRLMEEHNLPTSTDSIILIESDKAFTSSTAALRVGRYLKWPYNWLSIFLIVPRSLRDRIYDLIAKNRKKIMGSTQCELPIGKEHRFL